MAGRTIENIPIPSARFTANADEDMFGAGNMRQLKKASGSLMQIGQTVMEVGEQQAELRDKASARDSLNQAESEMRQYTADVYARKGKDAIDVYKEADQKINEIRQKYATALQNAKQQDYFASSFDGVMKVNLDSVMEHQRRETENYEKQTVLAQNQNAVEDAIAYRTVPAKIQIAEDTVRANTRYLNRGMGADIIGKAEEDAVHNLHSNVVDALTQDSPSAALGYIEAHRDKFNPQALLEKEKVLKEAAQTEQIRQKAIALSESGLPLDQQLAEVDKEPKAAVAKELREQVTQRWKEKELIDEARAKEATESEWDKLMANPSGYQIPLTLPADQQKAMFTFRKQMMDAGAAKSGIGVAPMTDFGLYTDLMLKDPKELAKTDLTQFVSRLHPTEYKELVQKQRAARLTDDNPKKQELFRTRSFYQQAQQSLEGMNDFNIKDGDKDKADRYNRFFEQFNARLAQMPAETRTEEAVGGLIKQLMSPVTTHEGWFNSKKVQYRFEVPYLSTKTKQDQAYKESLPETLKGFKDVQFDSQSNAYYIDGVGVRDVYDRFGNHIKRYVKTGATK